EEVAQQGSLPQPPDERRFGQLPRAALIHGGMMIDRRRPWRPLNVDGGRLHTVGVDRPDPGTLLARLDEADRQALLHAGRPKHYRAGEWVFAIGDPGRFVALIIPGRRGVRAVEFRSLVAGRPAVALELLRMIADRLRASDRRRVEFGAYGTTRRVARLLVDLAAEGTPSEAGVLLRNGLTQDDLAGMVGASRESVARALASLRELGFVST